MGGQGEAGSSVTLEKGAASACIAYALAVCERQKACGVGFTSERCLANVAGECPDLVFSPGSTRSAAGMQACAKAYADLPCEDVQNDVLPPCVTPGTRAAGEPCAFPSQCRSLDCRQDGDCGVCATPVALGESCAAPDVDCEPEGSWRRRQPHLSKPRRAVVLRRRALPRS